MRKILMLLLLITEVFGMAIKFSTSSIDDTSYATYDMNTFNGVDYTTTPTSVDETRAIDISNYLPQGNALVKRNGWEFLYTNNTKTGYKLHYKNIWKLGESYVVFATWYDKSVNRWYCGFMCLDDVNDSATPSPIYIYSNPKYVYAFTIDSNDTYSYGFIRGGRLFVFAMGHYEIIWYEDVTNDDGTTSVKYYEAHAEDYAYIPTIAIGVQNTTSSASSECSYEDFNMLSDYAYIELSVDMSDFTKNTTLNRLEYIKRVELGSFFSGFDYISLVSMNDVADSNKDDDDIFSFANISVVANEGDVTLSYVNLSSNNSTPHGDKEITPGDEYGFSIYVNGTTNSYTGIITLKLKVKLGTVEGNDRKSTINKMKFGCFYGADTYRDTLFVAGNETCKNTDYHTLSPYETVEEWVPYTYFGDMTFHAIGSSSSAIIGYGVNSDSSLTILKETVTGEPNVYFRTCEWSSEKKTVTLSDDSSISLSWTEVSMTDSVLPSAVNITCDTTGQIIQYDNGVFINSKDGIYYVNVSSSSAVSAYEGIEVSYLIRNDLGTDISDSHYIIYKNQLWIYRKDKNGTARVYVCDRNRYTYNNSQLIYEWWVLDNIPADKFYVFDNKLFFTNENGLYKFNDTFYDENHITFPTVTVGSKYSPTSAEFTSDFYFNDDLDDVIISPDSDIISDMDNSYDPKSAYENFVKNYTFTMSTNTVLKLPTSYIDISVVTISVTTDSTTTALVFKLKDLKYKDQIEYLIRNAEYYSDGTKAYDFGESVSYEYDVDDETPLEIIVDVTEDTDVTEFTEGFTLADVTYGFTDCYYRYADNEYVLLSDCVIGSVGNEKHWIWVKDGVYEDLGKVGDIHFNRFKVSVGGIEAMFDPVSQALSNVILISKTPVESYWVSKYNSISRLDYLKTVTNLYFVPDARRGGYTHVGYRTSKKDVGYYTNALGTTLDFNDIDFGNFNFGVTEFGRTYSSKKKIKNFSFIQLKFYSKEAYDSSIVACTFRYKYTKNNKGVK